VFKRWLCCGKKEKKWQKKRRVGFYSDGQDRPFWAAVWADTGSKGVHRGNDVLGRRKNLCRGTGRKSWSVCGMARKPECPQKNEGWGSDVSWRKIGSDPQHSENRKDSGCYAKHSWEPVGSGQKTCMYIDWDRQCIYYCGSLKKKKTKKVYHVRNSVKLLWNGVFRFNMLGISSRFNR
jgi:hypothetical protein